MLSVSQIARRFGLSRTTVLYYESCGLLKPALRNHANYRLYGDLQMRLLEQICLYRSVGLSVASIRAILANPQTEMSSLLRHRLQELDTEIDQRRLHQRVILRLLESKNILRRTKKMTKEKWVSIMKAAGFTEEDMHRWHREFERAAPDDHQQFLHYLQIPATEVKSIRNWSKKV